MSMPKPLKYILYALGGIILLLALLVAGVLVFIDPNDYRDRIEQSASEQLGRSVQLNGPIELSFFPWVGIEVQDVALANAQGFAPENMLSVHKADLKVKLLPLLSREVQVGTLLLGGATINLSKNEQGKTNWQDLAAQHGTEKAKPKAEQEQPSSQSPGALADLRIEKIQLQNTQINWVDKQSGTSLAVRGLNVDMGPIRLDHAIPLDLQCRVENEQTGDSSEVSLTGQFTFAAKEKRLHAENIELINRVSGNSIPGGEEDIHIQASLTLDMETGALDIPQFSLSAYDLQLTAQMQGKSITSSPSFSGRLAVQPFNPKELMTRLDMPTIQTTDPQALTNLQARAEFSGTPSLLNFSSVDITLDNSRIQGQASVDLTTRIPASEFDLHLTSIDIDRYLPPASTSGKPKAESQDQKEAEKKTKEKSPAATLPLEPLRQVKMDGRIHINALKVKGLRMQDITLTVQAQDGQIDISLLQGKLYGGTLQSTATVDVRGKTPVLRSKATVDSLEVRSFLQDLSGKGLLSGLASVQTSISTQGLDSSALLQALDGNLQLNVQNGSFQGADLLHQIRSTYLAIKGKDLATSGAEQTKFSSLNFAADITQGMVRKSNLKLISSLFSVQGSGQLDLVQRTLDYLLKVNFDRDLSGKYPELADLEGEEIPLDLQGSLMDPRYGLNKETLLQILGQETISKEIDKGVQKLEEKLGLSGSDQNASSDTGQKVKNALQGLFGSGAN
jgi:AsmA protein